MKCLSKLRRPKFTKIRREFRVFEIFTAVQVINPPFWNMRLRIPRFSKIVRPLFSSVKTPVYLAFWDTENDALQSFKTYRAA